MPVKIITRYDYEARASVAPGVNFDPKKDKSLTNQADMPAADINNIMARFEKTGLIPGTERTPMYGDFSEVPDYHTSLSAIRRVETAFLQLPAKLRNRFENDPEKLLTFLDDSKNDEEAVELGLKNRDVLFTALDLDGKTKITAKDRAAIDKLSDAEKAERVAFLAAKAASGAPPAVPATPVPPAQ